MTVTIKVHSARTTNMASRTGAIQEVSYSIFDDAAGPVGFRTAIRLPLTDIDGDGFVDVPSKADLAGFVKATLSNPNIPEGTGAGGFATALETLCDQLKTKHNAAPEVTEELSEFRPADGFDEDEDEESK